MHPSKGVQKNMLKALDFKKNKLFDRYFDNNLLKIFQTNILQNCTEQILLIVVLIFLLLIFDSLWFKPQVGIVY